MNFFKDWSWGAFVWAPFFLIRVKNYKLLSLYAAGLIPIIGFFISPMVSFYVGCVGQELARKGFPSKNSEEISKFMKSYDTSGIIVIIIITLLGTLFLINAVREEITYRNTTYPYSVGPAQM